MTTAANKLTRDDLAAMSNDVLYDLVRNDSTPRETREAGAALLLPRLPRGYKKNAIGEVAAHYSLTPTSAVVNDGSMIHGKGQPIGGSLPVTPTAPTAPVPVYRQEEWTAKFNDVSRALAEAFDQLHSRCNDLVLKSIAVSSEVGALRAELEKTRYDLEVAREKFSTKIAKLERLWIVRVSAKARQLFAWLHSLFE